jgi:hypothetical protein
MLDLRQKTIAFGGKIAGTTKHTLGEHGTDYGFKIKSAPGKGVDLLVEGSNAGAAVEKAVALGIQVISEDEYDLLIKVSEKVDAKPGKGAMGDYLSRFRRMVAALADHPGVQLLGFSIRPAFRAAGKLKQAAADFGHALPVDVKNLYKQAEGIGLAWIHRSSPHYSPDVHVYDPNLFSSIDFDSSALDKVSLGLDKADGVLWLMPLSNALSPSWIQAVIPFEAAGIFTFDYYSAFHMAGFQADADGKLRVLLGSDHGASWDECYYTDFQTYMELVLAHHGAKVGRKALLNPGKLEACGHDHQHWRENAPALDELLLAVRAADV